MSGLIFDDEGYMIYKYNKAFVPLAQELRRNMTPEEKHLWYDFLKRLPCVVNRQKNIGDYIVDFYISKTRTVIEVDGKQHRILGNKASDIQRDLELKKLGITIIRVSNDDINKHFYDTCNAILKQLEFTAADLKRI